MKKQALLVIADGMGDLPNSELNGQTPLEFAHTPSLAMLASQGMFGNIHPVKPGVPVGTDVGHLAIFGYDPYEVYTGRGPIEAYGAGIDMEPGDIAFRGNFATVDDEFTVLDRRAERINVGTEALAAAIDGVVLSDGTLVIARALSAHRVAVVLRGKGLSAAITTTDPGTAKEGHKIVEPAALDASAEAQHTAELVWELTEKIYPILSLHPVNQTRLINRQVPANMILLRGVGEEIKAPKISSRYGIKGACIAGDRTVLGIARMAGLDVFHKPEFTAGFDTDFMAKAELALSKLSEGYDWVVLHVKAPDLAGHDNLPQVKVEMAEKLDQMVGYMADKLDLDQCYISYTSDHSTPCSRRDHSGDPVPTFVAGGDVRRQELSGFGERYVVHGCLTNMTGQDFFLTQMDLLGVVPKLGA
ncbi:2,3-bisphosphoglycerate-independent phosphoglycerate mutase [Photobacterium sp. SDRW27]|uniref:2,3-bisphosphoglycerate-independent phosphoglycerate mutase n=1 Tax=Photobacterium obscurum TaxID=2829490 RepID=UPI002243450E|nr:2,3-bisphosphoglycerate-independent phosphoglycerate mutase [Photobacterium obscurum]MCW8331041.1 2,3-bisphosphoglycerate-independent phosphoglycerate mutase [Photobacterium obscurum]